MMLEVECMINIAVDMIIKDLRKKYFFTFINILLRFESSSFESSLNRYCNLQYLKKYYFIDSAKVQNAEE